MKTLQPGEIERRKQQDAWRPQREEHLCPKSQQINDAVRAALMRLAADEKEIVERYYFIGSPLSEIAADFEISVAAAYRRLRAAMRRLRVFLSPFVRECFQVETKAVSCLICESPHRAAIEELIAARKPDEPYRTIHREIRRRFGIRIVSWMTIVGHQNYH